MRARPAVSGGDQDATVELLCRGDEVAIVGVGCRFPGGADSPQSFWQFLIDGGHAVRELPAGRPWQRAGVRGGFLDDVDRFDAPFFGISASEARFMDPQQRLLLEVAWEAIENAGMDPGRLVGRRVGVFVGSFTNDYELLQARAGAQGVGPYYGTGTSAALLAGRIAYRFGLTGPALVVNTACSSSLVAMHLARRSLLAGESDLALVCGVNLILSDEISDSFRAAGMLAADAQCKPWDADADGYVRSEGCGVLLLEMNRDAQARGARVWALAIGSAVNQDGASGGITAPSAKAQQQLIEQALRDADLPATAVQYVEAHGTGTPIGDPIECEALVGVFANPEGRAEPLLLGSVKGNLGHTEAAAGLAGVIKVVLAMQHGQLPATVNHQRLNPELNLDRIPARIALAPTPWPADERGARFAGVNSFGFSGTNAHVILAQRSLAQALPSELAPGASQLLCLSAPTAEALDELVVSYESALHDLPATAWPAACRTAGVGRKHFRRRLAVRAESPAQAMQALAAWREGRAPSHLQADAARVDPPRLAFLFTGQGAQHWGMGRELFECDAAFRQTLQHCDAQLAPSLGLSLIDLMFGESDTSDTLAQTRCTQPALLAFQVSLAAMFRAWGIAPTAVLGHSVGEFAAAVSAGVMSLSDALVLVEARGRLMQQQPIGGMTAVQAGAEALEPLLAAHPQTLSLSAVNAPDACVIGGDAPVLALAHEWLGRHDMAFVELDVSHAFHTSTMQGMVPAFRAELEKASLNKPEIVFISTVTGCPETDALTTADYWCSQVVQPVRFLPAAQQLGLAAFDAVVEIGPSPVLVNLARRIGLAESTICLGAQHAGRDGREAALDAAARLYTIGVGLNHDALTHGPAPRLMSLPTYPFQRKPYWIESSPPTGQPQTTEGTVLSTPALRAAPEQAGPLDDAKEILKDYYRDLSARVRQGAQGAGAARPFVRFAPFGAPVAGFSWLPTFLGRDMPAQHQAMVEQAHGEMRAVLLGAIDFGQVRRVLDIGCGYATDLIELAQAHGHLVLDGCNISEDQIDYGRRVIARAGLEGRISLHHRDSSRHEFPGLYDVVVSHQVIHHIQDKDAVLRNVSEHLRKGGFMIAAEIISNLDERIDHDPSSAHFETRENWARLLASNHLRLARCVDASQEIANYLHDDDFAATLQALAVSGDESTIAHLWGPHSLGQLLRRGVAGYMLLLVQRDYLSSQASLLDENRARLANPTPYAEARLPMAVVGEAGAASASASAWPAGVPSTPALRPVVAAPPRPIAPRPALPEAPQSAAKGVAPQAPAAAVGGHAQREGIGRMVGQLLECSPDMLEPDQALVAQGLNSILAMDLTRRLKVAYGLAVPVKSLLNGASINSLSQLLNGASAPAVALPAATADAARADLLRNLGSLGEADINRLLAQFDIKREPSL